MLLELIRQGRKRRPARPTSLIRESAARTSFGPGAGLPGEASIQRRLTLSDICRDNLGAALPAKGVPGKDRRRGDGYFGNLKIQKAKEMIREGSQ